MACGTGGRSPRSKIAERIAADNGGSDANSGTLDFAVELDAAGVDTQSELCAGVRGVLGHQGVRSAEDCHDIADRSPPTRGCAARNGAARPGA